MQKMGYFDANRRENKCPFRALKVIGPQYKKTARWELMEGKTTHKMLGGSSVRRDHRLLAKFFSSEISQLPDRSLMEIKEDVNLEAEKSSFQIYLWAARDINVQMWI